MNINKQGHSIPVQERINRLNDLKIRLRLSKTTIYKKIANGTFPASVRISERSVGWKESDIQAWLESLPKNSEVA